MIDMNNLSYRGQSTKDFEKLLSDYIGAYVVCTNTGTSALHLALLLADLDYSDIICPAISFVATANVIKYVESNPIFCDVKDDLNIDIEKLDKWLCKQRLLKVSGIMPVHVLGNPCDMDGVKRLAKKHDLKIIEDSCQALGSWYKGQHCGTIGDFGAISFNGNKIVTTGGGGALITKSKKAYKRAIHLSTVAKVMSKKQSYHDETGFNYRMPAWNAQLGIMMFNEKKETLEAHKMYANEFDEATLPNNWKVTSSAGNPIWTPLHKLPMYQYCLRSDCSNAERLAKTVKII